MAGTPRVVVVGAGFGGLRVVRGLARTELDVTLVDRHNYHLFQPLLYQVATDGLEPEEIAYPVRRILSRAPNVRFRLASVRKVDLDGRRLETDSEPLEYDFLVLAGGSDSNFYGIESLAQKSQGLKDLAQAVTLRNHVLRCFERAANEGDPATRQRLLTFVIGGGGPTGVEYAGALSELVHLILRRDYRGISSGDVRIILVEGSPALLGMLHPRSQRVAERELARKGVRVQLNRQIGSFNGTRVELVGGDHIDTETLMWAAGVRAADLAQETGLKRVRGGRLAVQPTLQIDGHPEVMVIGDMAYLEQDGAALPMLAPVAMQQGELAAANILRLVATQPSAPFHYTDKGTMATIGRNAAVAEIGPLRLSGFVAWLGWLALHLVMLIGFRNRLIVLLNWAWSYFSFERAVRLITDDA